MAPGHSPWDGVEAKLRRHWPVLALLALALLVRLVGAFPLHYYGDEAEYATVARSLAGDPTNLAYPDIEGWGPHPFVSQPPVLLYLFALGGHAAGSIELGAALVSMILGSATVGVVYGIGVERSGRVAGSLAGLFLAVLPTHVSMSRQAALDAGLSFLVASAVLCFLVWTRRRTGLWALATGAAAAGAAFSKLYGALVYAPLLVGFVLVAVRGRGADEGGTGWRTLAGHLGLAALPGAVLTAAYLGLLAHLQALADLHAKLSWQVARVSGAGGGAGGAGEGASTPWHWYLTHDRWALQAQVGELMAAAALAGLAWASWRAWRGPRSAGWVALMLWPLTIVGFFSLSGRKVWFYVLPALPALAVLAGLALAVATERVRDRWSGIPASSSAVRTGSLAAALVVASLPAAGPTMATHDEHLSGGPDYGYGVKEAALWIDDRDPDAGQVGTLLGRFTLHFYNGHRTYHSYVPDAEMHRAVEAGEISYVVMDDYLKPFDQNAWMQDLVDRYDGDLVQEYEADGYARVKVYELRPDNGTAGGSR